MKKITTLDTRSEEQKMLDKVIKELPSHLELVKIQSEIARYQYDTLIKEGFTEDQALIIITTQPSWK